jgi:hypothetical protein
MLFMRRIEDRLDESHVAVEGADILRWTLACTFEHLRHVFVGNRDKILDLDIMFPVVTEIVDVGKPKPAEPEPKRLRWRDEVSWAQGADDAIADRAIP